MESSSLSFFFFLFFYFLIGKKSSFINHMGIRHTPASYIKVKNRFQRSPLFLRNTPTITTRLAYSITNLESKFPRYYNLSKHILTDKTIILNISEVPRKKRRKTCEVHHEEWEFQFAIPFLKLCRL